MMRLVFILLVAAAFLPDIHRADSAAGSTGRGGACVLLAGALLSGLVNVHAVERSLTSPAACCGPYSRSQ
jgi:hypothetical protein